MTEINASSAPNDWLAMHQNIAMELTNLRLKIREGNLAIIPSFRFTIEGWEQNLRVFATDEEKKQLETIKGRIKLCPGFRHSINLLTGKHIIKSTGSTDKQLDNLDEYEQVLRQIAKRNNFLTQVIDKRRLLT